MGDLIPGSEGLIHRGVLFFGGQNAHEIFQLF